MTPKEIADFLEEFPELKASIERIITVARNPNCQIELADDAEEFLLSESPRLNQASLTAWAQSTEKNKSERFQSRHKGARKDTKKN